jgi:hypothetical protein
LLDKGSHFCRREICRIIASDRKRLSFDDVKLSIHTECKFYEDFNRLFVYNSIIKQTLANIKHWIKSTSLHDNNNFNKHYRNDAGIDLPRFFFDTFKSLFHSRVMRKWVLCV